MVNGLIRWSLNNRLAVLLASALLLVGGGYTLTTMPIDVFPDLSAPTVTILVEGHGMAPVEMETLATFPIETAVNGATGVRRVRSATAVGIAVIWVEFEWGTDLHRARQTVAERLASIGSSLPPQIEPPVLAPINSIMGEILFIALTSDRHDGLALRTAATTQVRRRLLSVPGVSQVTPIGGDHKQYQVSLDSRRLAAHGVSLTQVISALRESNRNVWAGFITEGGQESIVQGVGRFLDPEQIAQTAVVVRDDQPVRIGDLGQVRIGAAVKRGVASAARRGPGGEAIIEPGVVIAVQKQPGANTLELTRRLDEALDEIQRALPEGMVVNKNLFRQSDFIEASLRNTVAALIEGGAMVVVVVIAFLVSARASVITLLAIPMSLVTAILALKAMGAEINTMTLGGMAIAIGALVDDAIIDVENVVRRLRENQALPPERRRPAARVVYDASVEVRGSIVFATLIIVLVFVPLFFLSGVEGRLLQPLGLAFTVALAASLVTALTLTPALAWWLLPGSGTVRIAGEPTLPRLLKRLYARPLDAALARPWLTIIPAGAMLAATAAALPLLGRDFLPPFNEGALVVGLVTLPGTSLQQSDELARRVERELMKHPEIAAIGRRTGRAQEDEHVLGVEASELEVTLDMQAPRRRGLPVRSKAELLEALRRDLANVPGVQATFGQPISHRIDHMLSGTRANIAVKIFGDDLEKLRRLAAQVQRAMAAVPGVVDLSAEQQTAIPTTRVEFDRQQMARHDLRIDDVAEALQAAFLGVPVATVLRGREAYDLVVRVDPGRRESLDEVGRIRIDSPRGYALPLSAAARIEQDLAPSLISRENAQRKIVVTCNVAGRDMSGVVRDIRLAVDRLGRMPDGYHVEYGGQFESAAETSRLLALLGVLIVLGIGFLLHVAFGSMRDALLVMVNLPLAMIGGVVGVFVSGGVASVASLIGFICVFGIAARNGIMLIAHIRHLQEHQGVADFTQAIRQGALERLAPILMTALAAGLALIPLAVRGDEPGTEILTPMAIVILFGLLSSTLLNMLVVPALYARFGRPADQHADQPALVGQPQGV